MKLKQENGNLKAEETAANVDSTTSEKQEEVVTATAETTDTEQKEEVVTATAETTDAEKKEEVVTATTEAADAEKKEEVVTATAEAADAEKKEEVVTATAETTDAEKKEEVVTATAETTDAEKKEEAVTATAEATDAEKKEEAVTTTAETTDAEKKEEAVTVVFEATEAEKKGAVELKQESVTSHPLDANHADKDATATTGENKPASTTTASTETTETSNREVTITVEEVVAPSKTLSEEIFDLTKRGDAALEKMLKEIRFYFHVENITQKIKEYKDRGGEKNMEAHGAAETLHKNLLEARFVFLFSNSDLSNTDKVAKFKESCVDAITESRKVLDQHRGWKQIFAQLVSAILSIGTLGLAMFATGRSFFSVVTAQTDASMKLDNLNAALAQNVAVDEVVDQPAPAI